jgi:hypothetical protein
MACLVEFWLWLKQLQLWLIWLSRLSGGVEIRLEKCLIKQILLFDKTDFLTKYILLYEMSSMYFHI